MKVGDLVRYIGGRDDGRHLGLVVKVEVAEPASNNIRVKWNTRLGKVLWHHSSVLEIAHESR